jgi:hypothetical protein
VADIVQQERHNITHAVGECIMTWATVEIGLTVLYCECIGSGIGAKDFWLHASIFDSVISIDARLKMISTSLEWNGGRFFHQAKPAPEYLKEWTKLRDNIRKKYDKRNEIAHSDLTQRGMEDGSQLVRLAAFPTLTNGAVVKRKTLLNLNELYQRKAQFENLSGDIIRFRDRVSAASKG